MGIGPAWEIFVDNFAGGGGASTGAEWALGQVHVAINHNAQALAIHKANHPFTEHYEQSITSVDPRDVVRGRPVGAAWFSPDCKHFSKAKGGKPVSKHIRDLAWVVVQWAELVRPRVIFFRAQGFPDTYVIDPEYGGKPLTKTAQVKACGNSVCPQLAEALVRANVQLRQVHEVEEPMVGGLFG